ncbi:MAG TPA: MFS transporter [Tepidisphaeraceae bacterium]|nr:MFS transporter [Tepidisphaeraceae bacterium]
MPEPGGQMDVTGAEIGLSAVPSTTSALLQSHAHRPPTGTALRRAMLIATGGWMFGSVWFSSMSGTPLTLYAKELGASQFQFGLLAALPFLASILSLPASILIEATGQRKRIFLLGLYLQRFLWFVIAIAPLWILNKGGFMHQRLAMSVFLWLMFIMYAGQAIGGPAWVTWMADLVPDRIRGKYFSRRRQFGMLTAVPAAWIVGWLLDTRPSADPFSIMRWCAGIFIIAAIFGVLDIHMFQYVPDIPKRPQKRLELIRGLRQPLNDRRFLWFAGFVGTLFFAMSFMGQFVTLYVMDQAAKSGDHMNRTAQMMLIVTPYLAQLLFMGLWGHTADRMGKKPLLVVAALGLVPVGFGWCVLTESTVWVGYVLSAVGAALWAAVEIANFNIVLEMSETPESGGTGGGSSYVAVNSVIINIAGCLGGLSAGVIAELLKNWEAFWLFKTFRGYDILFAVSAVMRLLAVVVFLPFIKDATARPTAQAVRFMMSNVYNNLFNALQQPLKLIRPTAEPRRKAA